MLRTETLSARRAGFTLVELLAVIAIIAILASLVTLGVFAMIGNRTKMNTEANIRVLHKMLQTRWAAVAAEARKETPSPQAMILAGGDLERARVIWVKVRLAEAFPINYSEMEPDPKKVANIVNSFIPPNKVKPHMTKYRTTIPSYPAVPGPTESSACLLMALRTLQADGLAVDDQMKNAIADTDGDTIPELIDGWGKPLAFFRFPWNDAALQEANPAAAKQWNSAQNYPVGAMVTFGAGTYRCIAASTGNQPSTSPAFWTAVNATASARFSDPTDPTGKLLDNKLAMNWYKDKTPLNPPTEKRSRRDIFEAVFHPIMNGATGNAYYTTPVIASSGKDGIMAVNFVIPALPGSADNIYSFQLRGD